MPSRRPEEWEYLDSWPPRMTRKTRWVLCALTGLAVILFLIGDLIQRLGKP
jgi:hypothetical protein